MKKVLLLLTISISITSYSQVDPSFTAKVKSFIDAAKAYDSAAEIDKPDKAELLTEAANAFYPITQAQFSSKFSAMANSPTEMAKLANPVGLVMCLGQAANNYVSCLNYYLTNTTLPPGSQCTPALISNVAGCIYWHL